MMPRFPQRFWLAALFVAWSVDFLFWKKPIGISFAILVIVALAAGFILARMESLRPARSSYHLGGLVLLLAGVTIWRVEGFSRVLNGMMALFGMALLVLTLPTGAWVRYKVFDYIVGGVELVFAALSRAAGVPIFPKGMGGSTGSAFWRQSAPVLRGVLLAVPIVLVMGSLLVSADLVFENQIQQLLKAFDLQRTPEYIFRLFYILLLAYGLAGVYLYAILPRRQSVRSAAAAVMVETRVDRLPGSEAAVETEATAATVQPAVPTQPEAVRSSWRFLGATETFIVLGSVDLLFAFFVGVQFRYFFGGQSNIHLSGFTYSDYARRGFFELVVVAVLSLMLYLTLNAVTRRAKPLHEKVFTVLSVLLVGLVWVILVSAFQRLLLYEAIYGFTSLRTYTHIFIPWLGFLLLATILLQILRREAYFGGLLLLTLFGFSLTFGVMNIDGFIAGQNIERARQGSALDGRYLTTLSEDALPVMVREFQSAKIASPMRDTLGYVLACRVYTNAKETPKPWQAYHPGQALARQKLVGVDLMDYQVSISSGQPSVNLNGEPTECRNYSELD